MSKAESNSKHQQTPQKAVAETLSDEILFRQPECTHLGDCPICCLPLSCYGKYKYAYFHCCSKTICSGCWIANTTHKITAESLTDEGPICLFCRTPVSNDGKIIRDRMMKRIKVGDPIAITQMGTHLFAEKEYEGAFGYLSKAAALGDIIAHHYLGAMYLAGLGVEKDEAKHVHHLEQAAVGGQPKSRYYLAEYEKKNGKMDRAAKHCVIAATLGHDGALRMVKEFYRSGFVTKKDFAAALRGHQAAIDATKSDQRTKAEEIRSKVDLPSAS